MQEGLTEIAAGVTRQGNLQAVTIGAVSVLITAVCFLAMVVRAAKAESEARDAKSAARDAAQRKLTRALRRRIVALEAGAAAGRLRMEQIADEHVAWEQSHDERAADRYARMTAKIGRESVPPPPPPRAMH